MAKVAYRHYAPTWTQTGNNCGPKRLKRTAATSSKLFEEWRSTDELAEEKWQFADVLRCSPDSPAKVWLARLEELRSVAYAATPTISSGLSLVPRGAT